MTKTTTNLLLMIIAILAGIYFYVTYCSSCGTTVKEEPVKEAVTAPVMTEKGKATISRTVVTLN